MNPYGAGILSFAWGFAEATFFFFVPDVGLTFLALQSRWIAFQGTVAALAGALLGGALMYLWGLRAPESARAFLGRVPGIHTPLVDSVRTHLQHDGLVAMLFGPLRGTPYKIYSVEWGALKGGFTSFLLISIPARYTRFLISAMVCGALQRLVEPWHLALFWLLFYVFYFRRFGW